MLEPTDHELLAQYARLRSETALAALVKRHVNLVYSTGLRFTGDSHKADEIAQTVFIVLPLSVVHKIEKDFKEKK